MLQNSNLLVSLSIAMWSARKHDKKITDEVREQHQASADAGRYNKLLAAKEYLAPIQKVMGEAREYHYRVTLPWGENNERLLPTEIYDEYLAAMLAFEGQYETACQAFYDNYDVVISDARVRLNGMFREADYPSRAEIESKFKFKVTYMPVPDTDIRVHLTDDQVAALKSKIEGEVTNRLEVAVKDVWTRVKDQLVHMRERLIQPDAVFRDSLFENLRELVHLLPRLNITNDPALTDISGELVKILAEPEDVRRNPQLRGEKAKEVQDVLNKFNSFFA